MSTPTRRSSSRRSSSVSRQASETDNRQEDPMDTSDLARPLPPSSSPVPPSVASNHESNRVGDPLNSLHGPGSVLVSEIDLSSPLNYGNIGTPSSLGSFRTPGGVKGTPIRIRSDIQSERKLRQVNVAGSQVPSSGGAAGSESGNQVPHSGSFVAPSETSATNNDAPALVIWGTDVSVAAYKSKFRKFLEQFVDSEIGQDEKTDNFDPSQPFYVQIMDQINEMEEPYMNVNAGHLKAFDEDLYRQLICYPQEVIPTMDMAVNEMFFEKYENTVLSHQIQVRPYNADKTRNLRALNPEDIDQLITISGMVIRTSNLIPEMSEALFRCSVCKFEASVEVEKGRIAEPTLCTNCNTNHSFAMVHNRCGFKDKQCVKLQESPDDMPPGQTPHTVLIYAHDDLVDAVQPGDRVFVTGIYRAVPIRVNPKVRNIKSVYKTHIDVVHFRKSDADRLASSNNDGKEIAFDSDRVKVLEELSAKPDIYERLARAIAPSIYENEDIKKGILLQLFGGARKDFSATGRGHFRSEINILLCGDPGTSKSQLLQYVYNLLPRSQYTSGKSSSAVGLTAYVTKDPETKQLVLQTGEH